MPPLPPEMSEKMFAHLPRRDLISVALTSRLFYHLALIFLYRIIHGVQLFGGHDQAHIPSLKCLETISSPENASQVVCHFAARGHPWIQEATLELLIRTLLQMTNLVSLKLDMGSFPEKLIFTESRCSVASFLPHLRAVSIHHYRTSVQLLKTHMVENARIKSDFGVVAFLELLPALRFCSTSLTSLQIRLSIPDVPSATTIMDHLARELPLLRSLGIAFIFPTPHWTERLSMVVKDLTNPLTRMQHIIELGFGIDSRFAIHTGQSEFVRFGNNF